jgi:hypothetical protein
MVGGLVPVSKDNFVNPVKDFDKFRQLIVSSEQIIIDAADQIIEVLPDMPSDNIEIVMSVISTLSKKLWYLRAACVAELLRRELPHPGGRGKKANGDGRNEFVKNKAAELGIKPTKLREDIRINEVFGQRFMAGKSGELEELSGVDKNGVPYKERMSLVLSDTQTEKLKRKFPDFKQTIKQTADGEFVEDIAFVSNDNKIQYAAHFSPHPDLNRQHYVVISKLPTFEEAWEKEKEVIKRIEKGEDLTATKLNDELFVKSDNRGTFFKIQTRVIYGAVSGNLELTLTEDDFKMLNEIVKLSLDIKTEKFDITNNFIYRDILADSGDGYKVIRQALQSYLTLLKSDPKKWGVERSFNPANFTEERMKAKHEAAVLDHKMWNRHRLDKEKLEKIELELKKTTPKVKLDSEIYKAYQKQLILVERAKINAEAAHASYVDESRFQWGIPTETELEK